MEAKEVQILGLDARYSDDQSPDGVFEEIVNLIPRYSPNSKYWEVFNKEEPVAIDEFTSGEEAGRNIRVTFMNIDGDTKMVVAHLSHNTGSTESTLKFYLLEWTGSQWEKYNETGSAHEWFEEVTGAESTFDDFHKHKVEFANSRSFCSVLVKQEMEMASGYQNEKRLFLINKAFQSMPNAMPYLETKVSRASATKRVLFTDGEIAAGSVYGFRVEEGKKIAAHFFAYKLKSGELCGHSIVDITEFTNSPVTNPSGYDVYCHFDLTDDNICELTAGGTERFEQIRRGVKGITGVSLTESEYLDYWRDQIDSVNMYCTRPVTSRHIDSSDGTTIVDYGTDPLDTESQFYLLESWGIQDIDTAKEIKVSEEVLVTKEVADIDAFTHHRFAANTHKTYFNRLVLGGIYTDFPLPSFKYDRHNPLYYAGVDTLLDDAYAIVTIKVDNQVFTRGVAMTFYTWDSGAGIAEPSNYLTYPDSRATNLRLVINDSGTWRYKDYPLKPHTSLNIAYHTDQNYHGADNLLTSILSYANEAAVIADFDNDVLHYDQNKVKISSQSPHYFPLNQTYEVGSQAEEIVSFQINDGEVSQGQFGQFPIYIFKENSIWALSNNGSIETLFSQIVNIHGTIGASHRDSIAKGKGVVYFTSYNESSKNDLNIYQLRGREVQRIDEVIQDHEYLQSSEVHNGHYYYDVAKAIMGYNVKTHELYIYCHHQGYRDTSDVGILSIVNNGGNHKINCKSSISPYVGQEVVIEGTNAHDGTYTVIERDASSFTIDDAYSGTGGLLGVVYFKNNNPKVLVYNDQYKTWYFKEFHEESRSEGTNPLHFFQGGDFEGKAGSLISTLYLNKQVVNINSLEDYDTLLSLNDYQGDDRTKEITLISKPIKFGSARTYKRLWDSFLRGSLLVGSQYATITLKGHKKGYLEETLVTYSISGSTYPTVDDLIFKTKSGSYQYFTIEISGFFKPGTIIEGFDFQYETRYTHKIRR